MTTEQRGRGPPVHCFRRARLQRAPIIHKGPDHNRATMVRNQSATVSTTDQLSTSTTRTVRPFPSEEERLNRDCKRRRPSNAHDRSAEHFRIRPLKAVYAAPPANAEAERLTPKYSGRRRRRWRRSVFGRSGDCRSKPPSVTRIHRCARRGWVRGVVNEVSFMERSTAKGTPGGLGILHVPHAAGASTNRVGAQNFMETAVAGEGRGEKFSRFGTRARAAHLVRYWAS